jgi:hypothetical protein
VRALPQGRSFAVLALLCSLVLACGGGGSGGGGSVIQPLTVSTATLPDGVNNSAYSATLASSGGTGAKTWAVTTGNLPAGLTLNATSGTISGTPTATASTAFTVTVTDSAAPAVSASKQLTVRVFDPLQITTTSPLPTGVVSFAYSQTLAASGGSGTYTWELALLSPPLPSGVTLSGTGVISGTSSVSGPFPFIVRVRDSASPQQTVSTTLEVNFVNALVISTSSLPDGIVGVSYNQMLTATGGTNSYTWATDTLPADLSLNPANGVIFGTPSTAATTNFTATVQNPGPPMQTASRGLSIRIADPLVISTTSLPDGQAGAVYSQTLSATGGTGTKSWALAMGSNPLPTGLTLSAGGTLSGTPVNGGTFTFTVMVSDQTNPAQSDTQGLSLTIAAAPLVISTTSLPNAVLNGSYNQTLAATGGTLPFNWTVAAGTLPTGLSLNASTGAITGTPTVANTFNFTVQVEDADTTTDTQDLSIIVSNVALGRNDSIATATAGLSNGTHRASISPYEDLLQADHDFYQFTATAGATVTLETFARRLAPAIDSRVDTVIEILTTNGSRFGTCKTPQSIAFDQACLNDDIQLGFILDSKLEFQVPSNQGATVTFYVRVLDFAGRGRPDFVYDLVISGVN